MDSQSSRLPDGRPLPKGMRLEGVLGGTQEAPLVEVREGEDRLVLRVLPPGADPGLLLSLAQRIAHPNLAVPTRWGSLDGESLWIARPYQAGRSLDQHEALPQEDVELLAQQLLAALRELHGHGLLHRDLKPANVLWTGEQAVLIDLDLVARAGDVRAAGTRGFLSPEILAGATPSPQSDLFALGVTLVHAAGLRPAHDLELRFPRVPWWDAAQLEPSQLPASLRPLVTALLEPSPAARPLDAASALELLPSASRGRAPLIPLLSPLVGSLDVFPRAVQRLEAGRPSLLSVEHEEDLPHTTAALLAACLERDVRPELIRALADAPPSTSLRGARIVEAVPTLSGQAISLDVLRRADAACAWILTNQQAREVVRLLAEQGLEVPNMRVEGVTVSALAAHLGSLTEGLQGQAALDLAQDLCARTGGRRSRVNAALGEGAERGVLQWQGSHWTLTSDRWSGSLAERGRDLPANAHERELLGALAVVDTPVHPAQLAAVLQVPEEALHEPLSTLHGAGWLAQGGARPGLFLATRELREIVSAALSSDERAALANAWLERGEIASPAARGDLLLASGHGGRDLVDIARSLARQGQRGRAQRLARAALEQAEFTVEAGVLLGRLLLAQGVRDQAAALQAPGGPLAGATTSDALLLRADLSTSRAEAIDLRHQAGSSARTSEERDRVRISRAHAAFLEGDSRTTQTLIDALETGDEECLGTAAMLRFALATRDEDWAKAEEALAAVEPGAGPSLRGRIALNRAFVARRQARLPEAARQLQLAEAAFATCDDLRQEALAANNLGVVLRDAGELHEARRSLARALRLRRRLGDTHAEGSTLGSLAWLEWEAGRLDASASALDLALRALGSGKHEAELQHLAPLRLMLTVRRKGPAAARSANLGPSLRSARGSHGATVARALAELALAENRTSSALVLLESAERRSRARDEAEHFRSLARLQTLGSPRHEELRRAGQALSSARSYEAGWRARPQAEQPSVERLQTWLGPFLARERYDLVAAVARSLVEEATRTGDADIRRSASQRLTEARAELTRGLSEAEAARHFEAACQTAGWSEGRSTAIEGEQTEWLIDCMRRLASSRDRRELLERILDQALLRTKARRGYVVLARGLEIETSAARGLDPGAPGTGEESLSRSVVRAALEEGRPISLADASTDTRFQDERSVRELQLRSVLCVPFSDQGLVRGAVYVDHDRANARFDEEDVRALQALADPAAIALAQLEERARIEELNRQLSQRVEAQESELELSRRALERRGLVRPLPGVVGDSEAMQQVAALVNRLAPTELPVVVTGPSGSGKELVARALHLRSHRAGGPLVAENVAALPEALLEAELFGVRKGAFTGATEDREGLFVRADGGTLFLDEIGDLPLPLQAKLLRVLETGEVRPVGATAEILVSVRIVAATHKDLAEQVRAGAFRQDLYFRLDGGEVRLPGLEERVEDVPILVQHFVGELNATYGVSKTVDSGVLDALKHRPWPGQVRELRNEVTRLWHLSDQQLGDPLLVRKPPLLTSSEGPESFLLEDAERAAIERALEACGGKKDQAARLLGISRSGLYTKLARLGL